MAYHEFAQLGLTLIHFALGDQSPEVTPYQKRMILRFLDILRIKLTLNSNVGQKRKNKEL